MPDPLTIDQYDAPQIATIMARKGMDAAAIGGALGCAASSGPGRTRNGRIALIGTGPGTWLAIAASPGKAWATELARNLAGIASVSDQSAAYVLFRIGGPKARDFLQRGAFIDLEDSAFGLGASAVTVVGHIGVIFWLADDGSSFELAVPRSFVASFRHWLDAAAAGL